jgi:type IV pilus biogenesis protein CpaD/CtpE
MVTYLIKPVLKPAVKAACIAFITGALLTACSTWETPTYISQDKKAALASSDTRFEEQTRNVDLKLLRAVADDYRKNGTGAVKIIVTYEPHSKVNTAYKATSNLGNIVSGLKNEGITEFDTEILPITGGGGISKTYISYTGVKLSESDCEMMDGLSHSNTTINKDYEMGCSVDRLMIRQVANPKDLVGAPTSRNNVGDARRAAIVTDGYRSGTREELTGDTFSER